MFKFRCALSLEGFGYFDVIYGLNFDRPVVVVRILYVFRSVLDFG